MLDTNTISAALRCRRLELGLSLGVVARRAGTSVPALSRYENGWTRFETYTLRKLAAALDCTLVVELRPRAAVRPRRSTRSAGFGRLQRLFWDHKLTRTDLAVWPAWLVERVLEYGTLADVRLLRQAMGGKKFLRAVAAATRVSPRTRNFWRGILEMEGLTCTSRYSRNTAWIS
jgi:transcriptional regulator with XRE-family HTH domain